MKKQSIITLYLNIILFSTSTAVTLVVLMLLVYNVWFNLFVPSPQINKCKEILTCTLHEKNTLPNLVDELNKRF